MTENSSEDREEEDKMHICSEQQKRLKRQAPLDDGMNTRNFLKKMTVKKEQKAQPKITSFMNVSNSTTFQSKQQNPQMLSFSDHNSEFRLKELEERMKVKDLQIQKMKRNKDSEEHRYGQLYRSHRQYKQKSKMAIAKSMLEAAEYRRAERRQINPKLGYFKDNNRIFVEGSMLMDIKDKIVHRQGLIHEFEEDRKSKDVEKKERALFRIDHINKEIQSLQKELASCQSYINTYKDSLKLSTKEDESEYAIRKWPIVFENYQTLELLGKGGFGEVYKVYDLQKNEIVSLKSPEYREEFIKHVNRQAETMGKLRHPNIGRFLKLLECSQNKVTFTLQYCNGPELSAYLRRNKCLEEKEAKHILRQMLSALSYLSSLPEKIIHYDLKPSNIMFHNGAVKILDFGLCKPMGTEQSRMDLTSQGTGTYWYLPPQTFDESFPVITPKVDVWSAGVIFFEMLYGRRPFGHGKSQQRIYQEGIILEAKNVQFPVETPKKHKVSDGAKFFIKQLLAYRVADRLEPLQAYDHQYFKK